MGRVGLVSAKMPRVARRWRNEEARTNHVRRQHIEGGIKGLTTPCTVRGCKCDGSEHASSDAVNVYRRWSVFVIVLVLLMLSFVITRF